MIQIFLRPFFLILKTLTTLTKVLLLLFWL